MRAIRFGSAIMAFVVSARLHTISSLAIAPINKRAIKAHLADRNPPAAGQILDTFLPVIVPAYGGGKRKQAEAERHDKRPEHGYVKGRVSGFLRLRLVLYQGEDIAAVQRLPAVQEGQL